MLKIKSSENKNYKHFKSLLNSKGVKKAGECLVMGKNLVKELGSSKSKTIHFDEEQNPDYLLSKDLFKELTIIKTKDPILLLPFTEPAKYEKTEAFEVFLPVGDPKNLGALIRTCLAFGVHKITLLKEAAQPFLPEAIRSSSGAVFKASLFNGPSLKDLDMENIWVLDKAGKNLYNWQPKKNTKLLLGEEGGHLSKDQLKNSLSIPISKVDSLNVNAALSAALSWIQSKS